jgi:parallel beta-helix repeat protein
MGVGVAHAQCPGVDDLAVQQRLDDAATAGGGTVQLDARVYNLCMPLILRSNVHLRGAGRGATIIRAAASHPCKTENGADVCASIGAAGAQNTSVEQLTVDHKTNGANANGIVFVSAGALYNGQATTNGSVSNVEVLGAPAFHNYMIWNLKGQHIKITDNWVDGGSASQSDQEGIESFGGYDVVIAHNTVQNIGQAGINLGSAGLTDSETFGLFIVDNYVKNCQIGVHIGTSSENGDQFNAHTHIRGNVITGMREIGIDVWVAPSTHERDLVIAQNTIRGVSGDEAAGIRLIPNGVSLTSDAVAATVVEGNTIAEVRGTSAHGIRLWSYPNARVLNNTISDIDHEGIFAVDTENLEVKGNRVERTVIGVSVQKAGGGIGSLVVAGNYIADWATQTAGILIVGAHNAAVRNNTLTRKDNVQTGPLVVDSTSCGVSVNGNLAWYLSGWENESTPMCN